MNFSIEANLVDIIKRKIFPAKIVVVNGKIKRIIKTDINYPKYILPGFVDSHIHIESSMLLPYEFARIATIHGTVAAVSDPHEITNVLGVRGVQFMLSNADKTPLEILFGAPSCVPATNFETSGYKIGVDDIDILMGKNNIGYLSEVMNFPAVINDDKEIIGKINIAKQHNKPIDGHAPGLTGENIKKYFGKGISTDHESLTFEEAEEKIENGIFIQIRDGSAASNFDILHPLIKKYPDRLMFCSDDLHPDDLLFAHINKLVSKAVKLGYNFWDVLQIATLNPIKHYKLNVGLLQEGDSADFIITNNLKDFDKITTYLKGKKVAEDGKSHLEPVQENQVNNFNIDKISVEELSIKPLSKKIKVIHAFDKSLFTDYSIEEALVENKNVISNAQKDILKIVVVNRYKKAKHSIGFIHNFGLKKGAIASSVAHDSHNIVAVGVCDKDICNAVNMIIENRGGLAIYSKDFKFVLPLEFAGLMSAKNYRKVADDYKKINRLAEQIGCGFKSPFMTLSFMALPVIPRLKITDRFLFDVDKFQPTEIFVK